LQISTQMNVGAGVPDAGHELPMRGPPSLIWLEAQRSTFEASFAGSPLSEVLDEMIVATTTALGSGARALFYFEEDVTGGDGVEDAAIRRFPVTSKDGHRLATYIVSPQTPRELTDDEVSGIELMVRTAALIISRDNEERVHIETRRQLQTELDDAELLRQLSVELADQQDETSLYRKLVAAAAKIMKSDVCTVQVFHPERGPAGELQMLASVGLNEEGVKYWEWVRGDSGCTCGEVLRTGRRAIAEDVANCSFMAGTPDRDVLLAGGIRAGQSTPLVTRDGRLVGMISTHWGDLHRPTERQLRMLDLIARPAADLIERSRAAEMQKLLMNELNHRVKNTLAVVQAMAQRTLAKTSDPREFSRSFGGRVQSLARTHELLSAKGWQAADLHDLVRAEVSSGFGIEARLVVDGPSVPLNPQMALHVAMIVHEMTTNALKHGALSVATGRLRLEWRVSDDRLDIRWTETGGPTAAAFHTPGFGSTLITQSAKGMGGEAAMTIRPEGAEWTVSLPYASGNKNRQPVPASEAAPERPRTSDRDLTGKRILVVEDEPLIGLDIVAALEDAGATVTGPAATIDEACRLIESGSFDAALVDANLHGHPVGRVAETLAQRGVPFAFATGYDRDGLPQGFKDMPILRKPSGSDQVVGMVARLLPSRQETRPGLAR
jgi:two-component sensor histidine kinase